MKKLAAALMVGALVIIPFVGGARVQAQAFTCDVGYTGPDSNNMCTSTTQYACTVTNENTVSITNEVDQEVASGEVSVGGNAEGGNSTSGTVTNDSGVSFSVVITGPDLQNEEEATCIATASVPATPPPAPAPEPEPEPTEPEVLAATDAAPTVLPATSSGSSITWLIGFALFVVLGATTFLIVRRARL